MTSHSRSVEIEAPLSSLPEAAADVLLALADDELVMGHRYSEWLGLSPFLEEDLTLASIAQDELGHARALYALLWPDWDDRDALVLRRPSTQWRSCAFVEREHGTWEDLFIRHWLYDLAEGHRWNGIRARFAASVPGLDALHSKAVAEERFHRRHGRELLTRLVDDDEGQSRLFAAFGRCVDDACDLAYGMSVEGALNFCDQVVDELFRGDRPNDFRFECSNRIADGGSRRTRHREFGSVAQSLVDVVTFDPAASW